ncbi:MAG: NUDIX hydrolase [PVC group bacterium]|nr:NUDIX hydrolase [PVC group bacterium]
MREVKNPVPTVDIIIEYDDGIVLIERKNPPYGWAIPGGFVDYNESLEEAAAREAKEETGLVVSGLRQLHTYSNPERDSRQHTISTVFTAKGNGTLCADTDASNAGVFSENKLPECFAFDHKKIVADYFARKRGEEPEW